MRKKIMLFTGGLVLTLGGFALYMYLTGSDPFHMSRGGGDAAAPRINEGHDIERLYLEDRDVDGSLRYTVSADRAKPESKTRYVLMDPRAAAYTRDGRMILVSADAGRLIVDPNSGKDKRDWARSITLTGHVTLTYGPQEPGEPEAGNDLAPGQIQITMEKDVEVDLVQNLISSPGGIHVRGDGVTFNGANLTLAFNQAQSRIEYLRIEYGDKITIKDPQNFGRRQSVSAESPARPVAATAGGAAETVVTRNTLPEITMSQQPIKAGKNHDKKQQTTYRLVFGQDVKATMGARTLVAQTMAILFQGGSDEVREKAAQNPAVNRDDAADRQPIAATRKVAATNRNASSRASEGIAGGNEELVVQWVGSMEMRPVAAADVRGLVFEATGTPDKPVVVNDEQMQVKAGGIRYAYQDKQLELMPQADGTIVASHATMGWVRAKSIAFNQRTGQVSLAGPGYAEMTPAANNKNAQPVSARWDESLNLEVAQVADKTGKEKPEVRRAVFAGNAKIKSPEFGIEAHSIDALIATHTATEARDLEHLLAAGDVKVYSNRSLPGGVVVTDSIESQKLEIKTSLIAGKGRRGANFMRAEGDVLATYHEVDKSAAGKVLTQRLKAPVMEADLEPRNNAENKVSASAAARALRAEGGVAVLLEGYGQDAVVATAEKLTADPKAGTARLESANGKMSGLARGENQLLAPVILFDQKTRSMLAPSAGQFRLVQNVSEADAKKGVKPVPVLVKWDKQMKYDGTVNTATFDGHIETALVDKTDEVSRMFCDQMQVIMGGAHDAGVTRGEGGLTEILASGNIRVEGAKLSADGKPIMQMLLIEGKDQATGKRRGNGLRLRYVQASQALTLSGPGDMLVSDHRPQDPKATTQAMRGDTAFSWDDSLVYSSPQGMVRLNKNVVMKHQPDQEMKIALPGTAVSTRPGRVRNANEKPQPIQMATQELTAYLSTRGSSSPMALGVGGEGGGISRVTMDKGTVGEFDISGAHYDLTAIAAEIDMQKHKMTARGEPLQFQAVNSSNVSGTTSARGVTMDLVSGEVTFVQQEIRGTLEGKLGE